MIRVEQTLRLLTQHGVEFVIVGGVAIGAHGSSYLTALINTKRAAGRTKDLLALPELEALREALEEGD